MIASKRVKYLKINVSKGVQDLCTETEKELFK